MARTSARERLTTRDLVTVGVFTAVIFVVYFATSVIGFVSPLLVFLGGFLGVLMSGIVCAVYIFRVPKFGALTTMSVLMGVVLLLAGHAWITPVVSVLTGVCADLVVVSGPLSGLPKRIPWAHACFAGFLIGPMLPILFAPGPYIAELRGRMGEAYASQAESFFTPWALLAYFLFVFVFAWVGGWLGVRVTRRHFARAGLA